jgi:hypothetical protein
MRPLKVSLPLTGRKAVVYFTAEQRVDFRPLLRELGRRYRRRVEMRPLGVRDGAKLTGARAADASLLRNLHGPLPFGDRSDGETSEPDAQPDQDLGHVRAADVLSRPRGGSVPVAAAPVRTQPIPGPPWETGGAGLLGYPKTKRHTLPIRAMPIRSL